MKNTLAKIACFTFIAAAVVATPAITFAADTNTPATTTAPKRNPTYHGKVTSVDAAAMTFAYVTTAGTASTVAVTSTTKITKDGKPAVFADITVGETVGGSYKKDSDGKATAVSVKIGETKKKSAAPDAATK